MSKKRKTKCPAIGCRKTVQIRGVCRTHYTRWYRLEDKGSGPLSRIEIISNKPKGRQNYEKPLVPAGTRKVNSNGFVYVKVPPDHLWGRNDRPKGTWVLEHRLVMMEHLGRDLKRSEIIRHKDEDKTNNSLDNLYIVGGYNDPKASQG